MALVVFTGGARSGKSSAAADLVGSREDGAGVSVVVFGQDSIDGEFAERIARHRAGRPEHWATIEAQDATSWIGDVPAAEVVLLDCLGTLLGLVMDEVYRDLAASPLGEAESAEMPEGFAEAVDERFEVTLSWLVEREGDTVVVTNEVGDGVVPTSWAGRLFRDTLGRANRLLVDSADTAYLCVAGRLLELHELPGRVAWPED